MDLPTLFNLFVHLPNMAHWLLPSLFELREWFYLIRALNIPSTSYFCSESMDSRAKVSMMC